MLSVADVTKVVAQMTSNVPNRTQDNLRITERLISFLKLEDALQIPFLHIAGTKGKGTTSTLSAELLRASGKKVGLFTSPHLFDIRERIKIDSQLLDQNKFTEYFFSVHKRLEELQRSPSHYDRHIASKGNFFRFMFLLSLKVFLDEKVDCAVLEVGIGGRIDATNVVRPVCCGITALGLDHMDVLGNTVEEIAREKAGIMKEGVPCFSVEQRDHPSVCPILREEAAKRKALLGFVDESMIRTSVWPPLQMKGKHNIENAQLALALSRTLRGIPAVFPLDALEKQVLSTFQMPGRAQILKVPSTNVTLFLDGAHTVESMLHATKWFFSASHDLASQASRVVCLFSSRAPEHILHPFSEYSHLISGAAFSPILATRQGGSSEAQIERVREYGREWRKRFPNSHVVEHEQQLESIGELLGLCHAAATGEMKEAQGPLHVFVCGSVYHVGNVLKLVDAVGVRCT